MGNTSVSSSRVVSLTKPPICANCDCKNRVTLGKIYCTLHDENPMRAGKPKKEQKKQVKPEVKPAYACCPCIFSLF